jgi:hypothetical protein
MPFNPNSGAGRRSFALEDDITTAVFALDPRGAF